MEWIVLLCKRGTHVRAWFVTIMIYIIFISDCLRFCFMHLIEELCRTVVEWNSHRIRPSVDSSSLPGPVVLYATTHWYALYNTVLYSCSLLCTQVYKTTYAPLIPGM
jgi:hypothetical protein